MITNSNHKLQQPVDDSLWDATDSILLKKLAENPTDIILIKASLPQPCTQLIVSNYYLYNANNRK